MQTIRIHSVGFRQLFILYHVSAGIGFLLIIISLCLYVFNIDSHMLLIIAGILMIGLPFYLAPPEIILDLAQGTFVFRNGMKCLSIAFKHIDEISVNDDIMLVRNIQSNQNISICQDHFKNIPLFKMKKYIEDVLCGNTNIDEWQYNSVKFKRCQLIG